MEMEKEKVANKEAIGWALTTQTLLVAMFMFLFYLKGENIQHLNTILAGSIFMYDYKKYQQIKSKRALVGLLIWSLIFGFSLITTLQMIGTL